MDAPVNTPTAAAEAPKAAKAILARVSEEIEQVPMSFWKQIGAYFLGAAFLGFVLKRYVSYVLFAAVIAGALLWFLQYVGAAQFDFSQIRAYFGVSSDATIAQFISEFLNWAKANLGLLIAAVVGFIVGLQLG